MKYPVQMNASNIDANSTNPADRVCACFVYSYSDAVHIFNALLNSYTHVMAWDADGTLWQEYDTRSKRA